MAGGNMMTPDWPGRIVGEDGHDRIAAFLVMDIQNAPDWGRMVLGNVDDVMAGRKGGWEMAMNAYILKVGAKQSEIAPVYEEQGEKSVFVSTGDVRLALVAWIKQSDNSGN